MLSWSTLSSLHTTTEALTLPTTSTSGCTTTTERTTLSTFETLTSFPPGTSRRTLWGTTWPPSSSSRQSPGRTTGWRLVNSDPRETDSASRKVFCERFLFFASPHISSGLCGVWSKHRPPTFHSLTIASPRIEWKLTVIWKYKLWLKWVILANCDCDKTRQDGSLDNNF